ncbi:MAG: hypothetical protein KF906_10730 [Actinobacteria bacterium]|nr:hypothetical protein [Actinomycetota bacterium]
MAPTSFRDRFFTRPVSHALTSPSGILAAGAGAAIGIVATAPFSIPVAVVGGVAGSAIGLGGRLLAAMPPKGDTVRIDPFAVEEPWRHSVIDALQAKVRFEQATRTFAAGPLRDAVERVGGQVGEAVDQCWEVAQQGDLVARARANIDDRATTRELERLRSSIGDGTPNDTQARTLDALRSQAESAERLDRLMAETTDRLDLLNARLDQSVTQAIELSVSNRAGDADAIGADVGRIVDELEALRLAMADVQGGGSPT